MTQNWRKEEIIVSAKNEFDALLRKLPKNSTWDKFSSWRLSIIDLRKGEHYAVTRPPKRYRLLNAIQDSAEMYEYATRHDTYRVSSLVE